MEILIGIVALIGAIVGAVFGHMRGKSVGKTQGHEEAKAIQNEASVNAAQERNHVEQSVASATGDDLDKRMRDYYRND